MARIFTSESTATTNSIGTIGRSADARTFSAFCWGTFDTATVKVQSSPDGGTTWFDEASFTDKGKSNFTVGPGVELRGEVTSVGGSTSVDLAVQ